MNCVNSPLFFLNLSCFLSNYSWNDVKYRLCFRSGNYLSVIFKGERIFCYFNKIKQLLKHNANQLCFSILDEWHQHFEKAIWPIFLPHSSDKGWHMMCYEKLYDWFGIILGIRNCCHKGILACTFLDSFEAFNEYDCQEIWAYVIII